MTNMSITDIDNIEALENFYALLSSILQIINAIVQTKGPRNNQTIAQGRTFLLENRQCMHSIFKAGSASASARAARLSDKGRKVLADLIDYFTLLISATGFLQFDDEKALVQKGRRNGAGQMFS